jgi:undecaprenyl diphosphate synthase
MKSRLKIPRHLAVIMDGNGRWARQRGLSRIRGHQKGADSVKVIARACENLGIRYLTLYALSTENLLRPQKELNALMALLRQYMEDEMERLIQRGIRLRIIGDMSILPEDIREELEAVMKRSRSGKKMDLIIALCYGSREEIIRAINRLESIPKGNKPKKLTESYFSRLLDTAGIPDPDLLIRTGGEMRISNFLLWQMAYTELYFTRVLWPEFRKRHLMQAIQSFSRRERRYGLTSEQVRGKKQSRKSPRKLI